MRKRAQGAWLTQFLHEHQLPDKFIHIIDNYYAPLGQWLLKQHRPPHPLFVGINGAQGTGKSTLAAFLQAYLKHTYELNVATLSIDDFYLSREARQQLAQNVHPLLTTRGVPGTHDLELALTTMNALRSLQGGQSLALPHFDKARDDRAAEANWPIVHGPVDIIVLEGWCVGSRPQIDSSLHPAINILEQEEDPHGSWRRYVNQQLEHYQVLFDQLDRLIMLKAPDFNCVYGWRLQQEQQLAARRQGPHIMSESQLKRFIQHYQRITEFNLSNIPPRADAVLRLNENHDVIESRLQPG